MEHSNGVHRIFINSRYRRDKSQSTSDFTYYVEPNILGVSRFKVNSVAVPVVNFTFQGQSEEARTVEFFDDEGQGSYYRVIFDDNKVYKLSDIITELNKITNNSLHIESAQYGSSSAIIMTNKSYKSVSLTKFPPKLTNNLSLPSLISGSYSTFSDNNNVYEIHLEELYTNYGVKYFQLTYNDAIGNITSDFAYVSTKVYNVTDFINLLNSNFSSSGLTFSSSGAGPYSIIGTPSGSTTYDRDFQLTAHGDENTADPNTFPQISHLIYEESQVEGGITHTLTYQKEISGEYNQQKLQDELNRDLGSVQRIGSNITYAIRWQVYNTAGVYSIQAFYQPANNLTSRTVRLRAFDRFGAVTTGAKINISNVAYNGISTDGSPPNSVNFTPFGVDFSPTKTDVVYGNGFNFTEDAFRITAGLTTPITFSSTTDFDSSHRYDQIQKVIFSNSGRYSNDEIISLLNLRAGTGASYGLTFQLSGEKIQIVNANTVSSPYGRVSIPANEVLGCVATEIELSSTLTFPDDIKEDHGHPLITPTLDFSTNNETCYLALPSLVSSSRCGLGHRSLVKSIHNVNNVSYGGYIYYQDDGGGSYMNTSQNALSDIRIQIMGEDHTVLNLDGLDVKIELEFI